MLVRVERFPVASFPFESFSDFEHGIDDVIESLWRSSASYPSHSFPAVDVAEYENETVVVAELPGVHKEDLNLSLHDGTLTIGGARKALQVPENSSWLRNETSSGEFSRTIELPHDVKTDAIVAELTNGVLRVVLPKSEEVRPREIAIQ
jgi:HSP20 family protein